MLVLRRTVQVQPDGVYGSVTLKTIEKGTPHDDIPESELAQLAAGHFCEPDEDGNPTDVWAPADHPELSEHVGRIHREANEAKAAAEAEGGEV